MPNVVLLVPINHNGDGDFVSARDWDNYVYGGIHSALDFTSTPFVGFKSVEVGITASIVQVQGQQPLTNNFNEISVCANDNNAVTMPSVRAGTFVWVIHDGARNLQVFPAAGDNFDGEAANASITMLDTAATVGPAVSLFIGKDNDEWWKLNNIVTGVGTSGHSSGYLIHAEVALFKDCSTTSNSTEITTARGMGGSNLHYSVDGGGNAYIDFASSDGVAIQLYSISGDQAFYSVQAANNQDAYFVWRLAGGSGTWFTLGREGSESTTQLKCTYGWGPSSAALFRIDSSGNFHLEKGSGYFHYGLGESSSANNEYIRLYHNGAGAYVNSDSTGGGTTTPMYLQTGGVTALTITIAQDVEFTNNVVVRTGNELRLNNPANTFYTGFKAPVLLGSQVYTMPLADGQRGQVLQTDGSGVLSFGSVGMDGPPDLIQDITFSNDSGTVVVFTVTGDVQMHILPVITTDLTSAAAANIRLGVVGNTDAMIVDSLATGLDARGIWVDQTPDNEIEARERARSYFVVDGNDVILTLDAQVDAGVLRFYCWWDEMSSGATVVNA